MQTTLLLRLSSSSRCPDGEQTRLKKRMRLTDAAPPLETNDRLGAQGHRPNNATTTRTGAHQRQRLLSCYTSLLQFPSGSVPLLRLFFPPNPSEIPNWHTTNLLSNSARSFRLYSNVRTQRIISERQCLRTHTMQSSKRYRRHCRLRQPCVHHICGYGVQRGMKARSLCGRGMRCAARVDVSRACG